ncbi:MAG: hypothetical protein ABW169_11860, partial [Sphingobium sp.]
GVEGGAEHAGDERALRCGEGALLPHRFEIGPGTPRWKPPQTKVAKMGTTTMAAATSARAASQLYGAGMPRMVLLRLRG